MLQSTRQKVLSLLMLLMLALTGSVEVKAGPDTRQVPSAWTNVRFNSDVRYSQWIINSRINDFYANSTHVGFGVYDADGDPKAEPTVTSKLDYVPGLVAKAIVENVKQNVAYSWTAPWYYSMKNFGDEYYGKVSSDGKSGKSQDDLNGIKMFFALEDLTASGAKYENNTTNGFCKDVMADARTGLNALNTNYIIGGPNSGLTADKAQELGMYGGWFHKYNSTASKSYTDQMWCDGLYMGPALLAQLINEYPSYTKINTNSGEDDWDLITRLFTISWNQLYDSNKGLLYHAFTANPGDTPSDDWEGISNTPGSEVYHSAAFWGRACGWYFLALVDILEQMDKAGKSGTTYTTLKGYLNSLAAGLANYQDATTGCWYQVLDEKDSHLNGNYLESSCTAIFTAAYLKGIRLGYYTADYTTVAQKAYEGCVNQFMMFDENNTAQIIHCCASAGLGGSSNRSGSRSYYITGYNNIYEDVIQRNTFTEGKVLGGFILAATEYERMYQSDKAILFSTDLKDSYSLENSGTISIEAFGADGAQITYQWYKDGVAVEGATNSTIAPTASGEYYCKATSGTTTIQSSTADVTVAGDDTFTPEFTTDLPATATATEGVAKTLTVAADHVDGYQWYSNTTASNTGGQAIAGATSASYSFTPAATGTLYYYCVATNSKATGTKSVASAVCTVTVSEAPTGATENITWSGSSLTGVNGTNVTAGTATAVDGSTYKAGTISSSGSKIETESKKHNDDSYWEDFSSGTQNASSTNATTTARIELPITIADGYTFNVSEIDFKVEQGGGSGPAVHVFLVQGSTSIWLGYTTTSSNIVTWNNLNIDLEAGSAKLVFVLGIGASTNLNNGRAFKFSNIAIKGTSSQTGGSPTTYTVSYNMNGHGEAIADVTNVTALPDPLPSPTATGYTFGGWYTDSGLNTAATAGASISANTTLYAKWTEDSAPATNYTVKFYNGDTQFGETQEIEEGNTVSAPTTNPTKDGYTFKGWTTTEGGTLRVVFPYPVYSNVNFYAVWSNTTSGGGGEDEEIFEATATATLSVAKTTTGQEITSDNAEISGGKMYAYSGQDNEKNLIGSNDTFSGGDIGFCFTNNNTFFKIELDEPLQAGDKITAKSYTRTDVGVGIWMSTETSRPDASTTKIVTDVASTTSWVTLPEYTVIDNDGICGESTIYLYRAEGKTIYFTDFTITREGQAVGNDITLDATTDYENFDDYVGEGKNVTLRRNFTEGKWTTLVLPFSVTTQQLVAAFDHADDCELAKITSMNVDAQGKGSIHYTTVSSIEANEPVLAKIKPNYDGKYVFNGVTVVAPTSVVSTSTDGKVEMHGVYKTTGYTQISSDSYFLSGGKFYDWSYLNAMSPFSAYILPVGANAQSVQSISFEGEETGIVNVNGNDNLSTLTSNLYNPAGQKVGKDYNGMIIIKGKKVFTK